MQIKNVSTVVSTAKNFITANSPVLLTGAAIAGVVSTGILGARAGYKARGIVDDAEADAGEPISTSEKVQLTWLCYAAPAITAGTTIASCVGVHAIHTKRHAGLAGLYAVASTKLDDYQDQAEKMLGVRKTQQLNNELAGASIERNPIENNEVIIVGDGEELCHDDWSGRYFKGNMGKIDHAINEVNRLMNEVGHVSLNEYYSWLGLPEITAGDTVGWSGEHVRASYGSDKTADGRPVLTVWFQPAPKTGYRDHRGR